MTIIAKDPAAPWVGLFVAVGLLAWIVEALEGWVLALALVVLATLCVVGVRAFDPKREPADD